MTKDEVIVEAVENKIRLGIPIEYCYKCEWPLVPFVQYKTWHSSLLCINQDCVSYNYVLRCPSDSGPVWCILCRKPMDAFDTWQTKPGMYMRYVLTCFCNNCPHFRQAVLLSHQYGPYSYAYDPSHWKGVTGYV